MISVIIPIYKVEKYLQKCIDSILAQTHTDLEIILIDDGSPDKCGQICDEYALKDNRIKVIHKENGGLSEARNAGLDVATGDYIGFVDGDDYIAVNMFEKLYECIINDNTDMVICNFTYVDEFGNPINKLNDHSPLKNEKITGSQVYKKFLENKGWYYVTAVNKLYKKELWCNLRFPYGKQHEDEFVAHKVVGLCESISCTDEQLYYYVQRSESITNIKYNIKRLDATEALIDRIKYFLARGFVAIAEKTFYHAIYLIREAYEQLDLKNHENKKRFYGLKNQFSILCCKMIFKKISSKSKIHFLIFGLSTRLYNTVIKQHAKNKQNR